MSETAEDRGKNRMNRGVKGHNEIIPPLEN